MIDVEIFNIYINIYIINKIYLLNDLHLICYHKIDTL